MKGNKMGFKEKVMKCIVEMGEEKSIKQISDGISTRAFFDLKQKFEKLENEILEKHNKQLIAKIDNFEAKLEETVEKKIKELIK